MQRSLQPLQAAAGFDLRLIQVVTATGRLSVKLRFLEREQRGRNCPVSCHPGICRYCGLCER